MYFRVSLLCCGELACGHSVKGSVAANYEFQHTQFSYVSFDCFSQYFRKAFGSFTVSYEKAAFHNNYAPYLVLLNLIIFGITK